ncbi:MAG TPA: divalent metal cation transporter, partial [Candidatus Binatus sp.]|nr:divalent metal cation transporter [Candidatus Binatus sp.]
HYAGVDVTAGMLFSNLVMYFVILATGATLNASGTTSIGSASEAAKALEPLAGSLASTLLAVGLIGGGVLAVPILAGSAAYALSEAMGWRTGLDERPHRAPQFYVVIALATIVGAAMPLLGINAIQALVATAIINGLVAPPVLALVMLVSDDPRVMGARTNGRATRAIGWLTVVVLGLAAIALVVTTILG